MRTDRVFHSVDSHTEGMPTRVITGGFGVIPGATMFERRAYFLEHLDHVRELLMNEPRGHAAMSGAILQPPTRPDADYGVLFIEVSGCLPMCGHGTIGVATVLVETGMVEITEPVTTIRLDTPAGLVVAEVHVKDRVAESVTLTNVPSFVLGLDRTVEVAPWGRISYDMAFGGNFYAIVRTEDLGIEFDRSNKDELLGAGLAIMAAIDEQELPVHPGNPEITGCHHVYLAAPGSNAEHSRHAMAIYPGWFDRSPCGTGTSARMAQLHARGELPLHTDFDNESFIGTHFIGRLVEEGELNGIPTVTPTITGRAWVTGTAQYMVDPRDPFPRGFVPVSVVPTLSALVLPDRHPIPAFLDDVRDAERAGVDTVWTYDHLTWPLLADSPWYGSVPLLAAAAVVTSRVRLGLQVATPNFRHPVPFAKELMTLDQLSGGRLDVGLGAGSEGPDSSVLGEPPRSRRERTDRFVEWIGLLDQLLRDPVTTVRGERYSAIDAHQIPGCVQTPRVPFTVAASGPRAFEVATTHGQSWVTYGAWGADVGADAWFAELAAQRARVDTVLDRAGRAPGSLRRIVQIALDARWPFESADRYTDTLGRITELGFDSVSVHWPRPDGLGVPADALPGVLTAHGF